MEWLDITSERVRRMERLEGWRRIDIPSSALEPIEIVITPENAAELAVRTLEEGRRPLDSKEREHALKRSTVYEFQLLPPRGGAGALRKATLPS